MPLSIDPSVVVASSHLAASSFFAELEDCGDGRADPQEGIHALYQGDQSIITFAGIELEGVINVTYLPSASRANHHILCMYEARASHVGLGHAPDAPELTDGQRHELTRLLLPQGNVSDLGEWCVVIGPEFDEQIRAAARRMGLWFSSGPVRYYDPETHHGRFPQHEEFFHKPDRFADQREFRFVLRGVPDENRLDHGAFVFDVGDLSHCVHLMPTRDFMENMRIIRDDSRSPAAAASLR